MNRHITKDEKRLWIRRALIYLGINFFSGIMLSFIFLFRGVLFAIKGDYLLSSLNYILVFLVLITLILIAIFCQAWIKEIKNDR